MERARDKLTILFAALALLPCGCHSAPSPASPSGQSGASVAVPAPPAPPALPEDGPVEVDVQLPGFDEYPLKARAYPDPGNCLTWHYADAPYAEVARGYLRQHHVLRKSVALRDGGRAIGYASSYTFYLTSDESPELRARLRSAIRSAISERRAAGLDRYLRCPEDGAIRLVADYFRGDLRVEPAGPIAALRAGGQARMGYAIAGDLRPLVLDFDATNPDAEPAAARAFISGGERMHVADLIAAGDGRGSEGHRFPVLVRAMRPREIEWAFDPGHAYSDPSARARQRLVLCARADFGLSQARFSGNVDDAYSYLVPVADPDCDRD